MYNLSVAVTEVSSKFVISLIRTFRRNFTFVCSYFHKLFFIFFLGDVFDEGKWSGAKEFKESSQRFHDLFPIDHSRSKGKEMSKLLSINLNVICYIENNNENS